MYLIKAPTVAKGWELAFKKVMEYGYFRLTEGFKDEHERIKHEKTIETGPITLEISSPMDEPRVSEYSKMGPLAYNKYADDLICGNSGAKNHEFVYTYHGRLFEFNTCIDQIEYIVNKLLYDKNSRRGVAVTWNPDVDTDELADSVPCLNFLQCSVRNNKLDMHVLFRSNDFGSALNQNMYALTELQSKIAEKLYIPVGTYTHIAIMPHVYYIRDIDDIKMYCKKMSIRPQAFVIEECAFDTNTSGYIV